MGRSVQCNCKKTRAFNAAYLIDQNSGQILRQHAVDLAFRQSSFQRLCAMNDYFYRLFSFNNWANQVVVNYLVDNQIQDGNCVKLMSHVFHAQSNWYKRIIKQQSDLPVWDSLELRSLLPQMEENGTLWLEYVSILDQQFFGEQVAYTNLAGQPFQSLIQDIITHVVNHGTHHRGQVIRRIRELGHVPPNTDFIHYTRIFQSGSPIND